MLKLNVTTKKFYNKWIYKVTLNIPGVAIYRLHKLEDIPLINFDVEKNVYSTFAKASANRHDIIKLSYFLMSWDQNCWAKRIERSGIDIYTNDKDMYLKLRTNFEDIVYSASEPDENNLEILENTGSVIVKKLPHDKYHYKAFLLPHKIKDRADKQNYLNWIDTQGDRILISPIVRDWFIKTEYNWDRRYVLVEDSQTLMLLKLRNPEALGRIYDYVISDK
jgi:hypothetical protein